MNVKKLKELLKDMPDDALVYTYADHGQQEEQTGGGINITCDQELAYYGDEFQWMDSEKYKDSIKITAICIG